MRTARLLTTVLAAALVAVGCTDAPAEEPEATESASPVPTDVAELSPEELILKLYADQDVDLTLALAAPGSIPDAIRDDVATSLGALLDGEASIDATLTHEIEGVTLTEVDTDDGIRWCVRPDNRILIQCRVGVAAVDVDTGDLDLEVVRAEVDIFPEDFQLRLQFRAAGDDPVQFPGLLALFEENGTPAPFLQTQAAIANAGQIISQVERDTAALPGTTLLLAWVTADEVALETPLELRWDGGAMPVTIEAPEWWVG